MAREIRLSGIGDHFEQQVINTVRKATLKAEADIKQFTPVDTGNLRESFDSSNTVLQRVATFIGFSPYEFGIDPLIELKEATKEGRGQGRKTSSKKCKGITSSGGSCKNNAQKDSDYCWAHQ